ncbi:uncharacterized protein [Antedon mediterranea]|uniref:uncharacterized protein n=1 Tax=Antedon mediterranea TaxID=105859 RepID=UPI003AF88277
MALQQIGSLPPVQDITNKLHSGPLTVLLMATGNRGKWKKRYVVVSSSHIYLYDKQNSKGKHKDCGSIDLQDFKSCGPVNNKQLKKKYVIVIQPINDDNQEWMFSSDDAKTHEKWLQHIDEALQKLNHIQTRPVTVQFDDYTLETEVFESHIAKERPKGPERRAPTRRKTMEVDATSREDDMEETKSLTEDKDDDAVGDDGGGHSSGTDEELDKDEGETEKKHVTELKPEHFPKRINTPPLGIASLTSNLAKEAAQKRLGSRKDEEDEETNENSKINGHAQGKTKENHTDEKDDTSDAEFKRGPSLVRRLSNSFKKNFSGLNDSDKTSSKPSTQAPLKKPKPGLRPDRPNSLIVQGSPKMHARLPTLHSPGAPHKAAKPIVSPKTPTDVREAVKTLDSVTESSEKLIMKAKALRNAIKDFGGGKNKNLDRLHAIERNAKFALADLEDAITQLTKAQDELNK